MALKKSELYSSLWSSCDELRGSMDASQYKDYVLSFLFIKYVSDKYAGIPYAPIKIPNGANFAAMVALKGKSDIGDQINKKIIAPLAKANDQLNQTDFPDFNDSAKLGTGKEKVEKLTSLIAIFQNPALDFSKNRAEGDDILGDAYEYLMRHFASDSGKSKGQFYTPAEVSRIMAQIIGIGQAKTNSGTTVYDPTCGSGSLLLKVGDAAGTKVSLYGQEKDSATSGLARMNMILHDNPTAQIVQGNTLADPKFKVGEAVKQFDFVVANPPFSDKRWSTGLDPLHDPHNRFKDFGIPPNKQGDYAYLLHIVRSLKSAGSGACILPHGVLFRGNVEADIRRALVRRGWTCDLIPKPFIVARFFPKEQAEIDALNAKLQAAGSALAELDEEHGGEDGLLAECRNDKDKVTAALLKARRKALAGELDKGFFKRYEKLARQGAADEAIKAEFLEAIPDFQEMFVIDDMLKLLDECNAIAEKIEEAELALDAKAYQKYPKLTEADIKALVVDDKWMVRIDADIHGEMDRISQALSQRVRTLAERYEVPLPTLAGRVANFEGKVERHLKAMGFAW